MDTGQPDPLRAFDPASTALPSALKLAVAAHQPPKGGSTLVLDMGGQNVVVVIGEGGGDARLMWAFIQHLLSGRKAVRM
jgi:hypothetical protein